ncbi:hypothetical protein K443DRAFT_105829 [Laccaria amethystina LaAM-08-1]|uniref:Unplaced genomic scaffold K443scaffold_161, whole genome shotgun sequence n=1 Tax=Laccaria amethystina LaAM-08-1 TaxID=1095629 RepID=A0A0C9XI98_9AGAR|nr:hypothetical protein K443DRAFT_105829 [Laccaria amethystina LaAM-08-1]
MNDQYFTLPHIIHMDSTGLHWTANCIQHKSGLHCTVSHSQCKLDSTGLQWTVNHIARFQQNVGILFIICKNGRNLKFL